jgi:hypothetical protein
MLTVPLLASAATLRVDCDGEGDFLTIADAVAWTSHGDTILVAPGVYAGPSNRDIEIPYGELSLLSEAGAAATIIDCESAGRSLLIERPGVTVQGFTITGGSSEDGGAIWIGAASPLILDCEFVGNCAERGGALYCATSSQPVIEYCTFTDNTATCYGGAACCSTAKPRFYECQFTGNEAVLNGGAFSIKQGSACLLMDCSFRLNSSAAGGAIYIGTTLPWWPDPETEETLVAFSSFSENEAERGGAIFVNARSHLDVIWCTLERNRADYGGGIYGVTSNPGIVYVQNCTFARNAAHYGGGVCTDGWYYEPEMTQFLLLQCVIAFSEEGSALCRLNYSPSYALYSLAYGNPGGDALYGGDLNIYEDPLFCDMSAGDYALCENSLARAANNYWSLLMGVSSQHCGPCDSPVRETTWGGIKARYR